MYACLPLDCFGNFRLNSLVILGRIIDIRDLDLICLLGVLFLFRTEATSYDLPVLSSFKALDIFQVDN